MASASDPRTGVRIVEDSALLARFRRHIQSWGVPELLMPATARRELLAAHGSSRSSERQELIDLCHPVPDGGFIVGVSAIGESRTGDPHWIEKLRKGKRRHNNDALTASATRFEDAGLFTGDNRQARQTQKLMRWAPTLDAVLRQLDESV